MIKARDAIAAARALLGTPYAELDCIGLIKRVIRTSPGGVPGYTTAGTNTLWNSRNASAKYRDLTYTQEGISDARAGMLAFKRSGSDVHHVGLVTDAGTVIHSSSTQGGRGVVETPLDKSWDLLAKHRYIEVQEDTTESEGEIMTAYKMRVHLSDPDSKLNVRDAPSKTARKIGSIGHGATVIVQAEMESGWRFVSYGDSGSGYVDGSFLEKIEETEQTGDTVHYTTLISDDTGAAIMLVGRWHVADD